MARYAEVPWRRLRGKRPDPNLREDGGAEPAKELEKVAREVGETLAEYRAPGASKAGSLVKESMAASISGCEGEPGCGLRRDTWSQDQKPLLPLTPSLPFSLTPSFAHPLSCLSC